MRDKGQANRQRIVMAAAELFYRRGFDATSFADVSRASGIPKGNFYYYFKSKDQLLRAVVEARTREITQTLAQWEAQTPAPRERLRQLAGILRHNAGTIGRWGCPIGSLSAELGKSRPDQQAVAQGLLELFRAWAETQFRALGRGADAAGLATHLICMLQGAGLVAAVYGDVDLLATEADQLEHWIDSL